ncbi:treslin-like [Antedon mediterranea]|uniref:treslin-like n=1 Tax=Antedon mediterranea TaxID=105859 RepID=UPI003AF753D3
MPGNDGEHLQVVFLIDTRTYNNKDNNFVPDNKAIDLSKTLSLSALKMLQSLVSLEGGGLTGTSGGQVKSIRWGYKFFDSLKPCSGYRLRDFHDFNLTNFEKFEEELKNKFKNFNIINKQNESSSNNDQTTKKHQPNTPLPGLKIWSQDYAPADHLAVALCEVAQDFQWQAPDIMSPSRSSRRRSEKDSNNSSFAMIEKTNLTFLFMACPWNIEDLKEFVKMRSNEINTNDLLDVVVHEDVRTDFLEKHHVKLIWFDTRVISTNYKMCKWNKHVFEIVQGMMSAINGHLIPLNAILSTGSKVTSSIRSILNQSKDKLSTEIPKSNDVKRFEHLKTVSNCMIASSIMDYTCCKANLLKRSIIQESLINAKLFLTKGCDVLCCLKITPLAANQFSSEQNSPRETRSGLVRTSNKKESFTGLKDGIVLNIQGLLVRNGIPLRFLRSKSVYSCLGIDSIPAKNEGDEVQLSSRFSALMKQLATNKKVLVVDVCHSEWISSIIGILEPFTVSSASLRLIRPDNALNKQTILGTGITFTKTRSQYNPLSHLVESSVTMEENVKTSQTTEKTTDSLVGVQQLNVRSFRPYMLESWYKSAPSSGVNSQYITQLTSIQGDNSNGMATGLSDVMMNLRDSYCKDPAVLGKSTLPASFNNPQEKTKTVVSNQVQNKKKTFIRAKSFGGINTSRTDKILENSKKMQKNKSNELENKEEEERKDKNSRKDKPALNLSELAEFTSSDDLVKHLKDSYEKQLQQDSCPCLFAQTIVSISNHYMKVNQSNKDTIEETKKLIKDSLVLSSKQLREKYQKDEHKQASVEERICEVILQVVLQLEMEALSPTDILNRMGRDGLINKGLNTTNEDDVSSDSEKESDLPEALQKVVDEMVAMLQTIPFLADHNKLTVFLKEKMLPNYTDTVPYMLVGIYEGLMQPVPSVLCSPTIEDLMSIQPPPSSSYGSVSSLETTGSVPNRPRGLKRLPSIANIPTRTISVDLKKNESKPKESKERRKKKPVVDETKKVRRNLFIGESQEHKVENKPGLTRRKSVAVMQTTTWKSPRRGCSRAGAVLKTKIVKETPGKRQVISAMLEKMERARQRQKDKADTLIQVIEESPVKSMQETHVKGVRSSPRIKASNTRQRTRSFYSKTNKKDSRNLAKALTLGARIRGDEAKITPHITRLSENVSNFKDINKPKDSEIVQESPSKFLLSEIFSPEKLQGIRKVALQGLDSPSNNTRQKVTLTPNKQDATEFKKCLTFSPTRKDLLTSVQSDIKSEVSPFKSPIGTPLRTPRKTRNSLHSHGSAEKAKQSDSVKHEINTEETNKLCANKKESSHTSEILNKLDSPSTELKVGVSPRLKLETFDNWPRKKVRSGTPSPIDYKTPSPSCKAKPSTNTGSVWIETHKQSPTFERVTPRSTGSASKVKECSSKSTRLTRSNSKRKANEVQEKNKTPPKSRRRLPISRNNSENIHCSFSSSAEDEEDLIPFVDDLFTDVDRKNPDVVALISAEGLDSDSDPEIDFPKNCEVQKVKSQSLLTPTYSLRRKRSLEENSSEKPQKISRKKTPDFRNAGSSFDIYQSQPETKESRIPVNTLQIPGTGMQHNDILPFRKPSRRKTQNMPSTSSGRSAFSSCGVDLSCSEISNISSVDVDDVFTEEHLSHETPKSYKSPRGTPNHKHTPLSVRGLSQLLSSPLVSPSQKKSFAGERRLSRRKDSNFSSK